MANVARKPGAGMDFSEDDLAREPFGAYLLDDSCVEPIQETIEVRGWSATHIRKGGLSGALRLLGIAPPPKFMIIDIEGESKEDIESGIRELARLGSSVIALGTVNDVDYFRTIMRSGAKDYLMKPVTADALGEVFVRLEQPSDGVAHLGRVIGILGARGGVGVTTLAINTAWTMAEKLNRRTSLVDMDLYAGNIALSLDIDPTRGLREAFDDPERVDEVFLQNAMAKLGKSLHILATEEAFDDTVRMNDATVLSIADTMRTNFDMTVLDLPRHFVMREPQLFTRCDDLVIVAELTLQSLRDTNRLIKLLKTRNRNAKMHVVVNRVTSKPDVSKADFEAGMEGKLRCSFPLDTKATTQATLKGEPLAQAEPRHKMIQDLQKLCVELAGVPEESKKKGFLSRAFGRK